MGATSEEGDREEGDREGGNRDGGNRDGAPADGDGPAEPRLGALGLQGHIDAIDSGRVYGWAWDPEAPEARVRVDLHHKGTVIGTVTADRFRQDLADLKVGDGSHAFVFDLPPAARDDDPSAIAVYFTDSQMPLSRGQPLVVPAADGDRLENLAHRTDRIEAALQQMYRVVNVIRRGDDDTTREAHGRDVIAMKARLERTSIDFQDLTARVDSVEQGVNALRSLVDRLEVDLYDRPGRTELEDLRRDLMAKFRLGLAVGVVAVALTLALGYAVFRDVLPVPPLPF